jgi:hypothetical protein
VTSNYFGWLDIEFFTNHKFGEGYEFNKEVNFVILLSDGFAVKLSLIKKSLTVSSFSTS